MRFLYDQSLAGKLIFPSALWENSKNKIILTFDDGPTKECLPAILNFLSDKNIKAIFFCVGENIKKNVSLAKEIIAAGHLIGNHTFNHVPLTKLSSDEALKQIRLFEQIRNETFGDNSKYFRPPHGKLSYSKKKIVESCGLKIVMWSLLTWDFKGDWNLCKKGIERYLKKNSIAVFHDNIKAQKILIEGLNFLYEIAISKNFIFGELE